MQRVRIEAKTGESQWIAQKELTSHEVNERWAARQDVIVEWRNTSKPSLSISVAGQRDPVRDLCQSKPPCKYTYVDSESYQRHTDLVNAETELSETDGKTVTWTLTDTHPRESASLRIDFPTRDSGGPLLVFDSRHAPSGSKPPSSAGSPRPLRDVILFWWEDNGTLKVMMTNVTSAETARSKYSCRANLSDAEYDCRADDYGRPAGAGGQRETWATTPTANPADRWFERFVVAVVYGAVATLTGIVMVVVLLLRRNRYIKYTNRTGV